MADIQAPLPVDYAAQPVMVRFQHVTKSYGAFEAVRDLDLDIAQGEFVTFLGPSGSGKTTSLMLLAGFERPSQGTIELDGQAITRLPPYKRDIGVVFQNYALFPHMSVAENVAFPLKARQMARSQIEEEVRQILSLVRLQTQGHKKPKQLSGGQQQRVALARALVFKPRLIVLDEPLSALDRHLREQMQDELTFLHHKLGITMIFVTHDQSEALRLSDRIALFNQGRIEQVGTPEMLYQQPKTAFVAGFIGDNNLICGQVEKIDGSRIHMRCDAGGLLIGNTAHILQPGAAVVMAIRPEHCRLISPESKTGRQARVIQTTYLGDGYRLDVVLEGIGNLKMKMSASDKMPVPGTGSMVSVEIAQDASHILAASAC